MDDTKGDKAQIEADLKELNNKYGRYLIDEKFNDEYKEWLAENGLDKNDGQDRDDGQER